MKQTATQFNFSAQPKVTALKPKYRQDASNDPLNLMNDPRVVRGNTYAAIVTNKNQVQPPPPKKAPRQFKKPAPLKNRQINFDTGFQPTTPRAVQGRLHYTCQTEPFVQTLRDRPIQYEKESQTDFFLDRPVQRQFDVMKWKLGVDRSTQIAENDPELFNFDYQVQPIVQALLNKIIQTSRMELYEEDEQKQKQTQKLNFERKRHARLAEAQMLQANQNRLKQQYQRRELQYKISKQQEIFTQKKIISRILSKQYIEKLKGNTYQILEQQGFFRHPLETNLYENLVPWLYDEILDEIRIKRSFAQEIETMLSKGKQQLKNEAKKAIEAHNNMRNQIQKDKQENQKKKVQRRQSKRKQKEQKERLEQEIKQRQNQQGENPPAEVPS